MNDPKSHSLLCGFGMLSGNSQTLVGALLDLSLYPTETFTLIAFLMATTGWKLRSFVVQ